MPLIDLRQARSEIRLAVVLGLLGWRARERSGEQVRGPCPVHRSSSPGSRSLSARLGRNALVGFQGSARTGYVRTELRGDRTLLTGRAVTVIDGELLATG